ncbi:MAG: hypothetical protein OXE42_17730 [Gammaproteobacteria bacterium]|nr:hypothetical protein [Gammaproteobacteria bacterium]
MENELHRNPATPEEIWAILRSVSEKQEKSSEKLDKLIMEADRRQKQIDRQLEETRRQMQDTDRRLKKTDELFNSQWGKLVESLVEGDLVALLQARDIEVQSTHPRVSGRRNGEHYEFDILAINGEEVVVVEVKTTLRSGDVTHFLGKLARFTEYEPVWKGKHIFGAVAYLKTDASVQAYAERQGLFVIRATGNSASIINPADFRPRVFR